MKGVNKWVAHYYLHEEDPYYLGETTVSVVITYGDLKLKKLESSNGATIAQKTVRSTAYQNSTLVKPVYTLNGAEVSQNDLSRFGYEERREVSGKKDGILSAAEEGADDEYYYRVVGEETGKDTLIWNSRFTSSLTGSTAVLSSTLAMKVAGEEASAVQGIDLWINDEKCGAGDEDDPETVWQVLAEDVKSAKQEYELTVGAVDFSGAPADTAITWTTSNKSVAYVTKAKDGSIKLVIPKGRKGGTARITATAKDYHKAGASFTVQVVDDDFRLETTRLTLNSNSREFRTIRLYGNKAYLETKQAVQPTVEVRAVKKNGELDDRFQFETSETPGENGAVEVKSILKDGTLGVQFREPQKAGTTTMILELHLFDGTNVDVTKKVTISVTNKPTVPKTAAKVTRGYNPFWNGNEAYAKVLLTTAEAVQEDKIRLEEGSGYQLVDLDLVDNDYGLIWEATLKAENPDKVKTGNVAFQVSYDPDQYRIHEISVNAKIPVKNSAPTAAVYGDNIWDAFWFPETGETAMDVLVELPDGMEPSEITDVALTAAGQKNFEVSSWEPEEYPYVKKNGKYMELNAALRVHLVSKTGKTGNVQFVLCSDSCSKPIMSKTKAVTAKKLSGEKAVIYDAVTGKSTSAYTLQMARAGKEAIRVSVYDRNLERYPTDVKVEGGDVLTTSMLGAGSITVEKSEYINDTYLIRTTEDAFRWGAKSCRLKFTVSIEDEETGESYSLKPVTLTINLKSQKTLPAMKATVKTVGTLDAANRENEAELKISIQNLPQGAEITKVQLTGDAAKLPYGLAPDFEGNTVILGLMEEGEVPIGKNKVELLCTVRLADGSCVQVPAMATVNVTQKATVKVSQKSATLYSAVDNPEYENLLQIVVENAGENELEFTGVRGPEGKGIYAGYDETTQAIVISPNEMEPLHAGSYKYVYTFTLKHSGTKGGSKMVYSVPVVVTVKK